MSYIVPRDKPKRCTQPKCRFMDRNTLDCRLQGKSWESFEEQYEHCPLIEIPAQPDVPDINVGDMISRQAAIDAVMECYDNDELFEVYEWKLNELPAIQPKRGKWIYCEDTTADCVDGYRCDQCGFFVPWDYKHKGIDYIQDYNFCPNCGADMRGEKDG